MQLMTVPSFVMAADLAVLCQLCSEPLTSSYPLYIPSWASVFLLLIPAPVILFAGLSSELLCLNMQNHLGISVHPLANPLAFSQLLVGA